MNVTDNAPVTTSSTVTGVLIFSCVVFGVAGVVGTTGNVTTLVTLVKYRPFQSAEIVLFANLLLSDMFVTAIADPVSIIAKTLGWKFFSPLQPLCVIIGTICTVSCVVSLLTIATIGVNRYLIVCHSHGFDGKRVQSIILTCIYGWALTVVSMTFFGFGHHGFNHKTHMCLLVQGPSIGRFMVFFVVVCLWTPMLATLLSYGNLYHRVAKSRRRIVAVTKGNRRRKKKGDSVQLAKTAFTIFSVFVICWFPISLLFLLDRHGGVNTNVGILLSTFAHIHPSLNFFVFYGTNKRFRNAVKALVLGKSRQELKSQSIATITTEM
ncbi:melatonin-related receptor-like [Haliotis rubra]|uniref:melatonin-related receptor-like n=1 Tax=Haliotis rubra TaxID=36100 RepID=UPI001EE518F2|nr:melatonin-related receptor-like [Haliotis rubra]